MFSYKCTLASFSCALFNELVHHVQEFQFVSILHDVCKISELLLRRILRIVKFNIYE